MSPKYVDGTLEERVDRLIVRLERLEAAVETMYRVHECSSLAELGAPCPVCEAHNAWQAP